MTAFLQFSPAIPHEIWLHIFKFVTLTPSSYKLYTTTYTPFEDPSDLSEAEIEYLYEATSMQASLVLVSKLWYTLMIQMLYESIEVNGHGALGLLEGLLRSRREAVLQGHMNDNGSFVRRITLAVVDWAEETAAWHCPKTSILEEILKLCPNLKVLAKHATDCVIHNIEQPDLLNHLLRFDWQTSNCQQGYEGEDDDFWKGIPLFFKVLNCAPNLCSLNISSNLRHSIMPFQFTELQRPTHIYLPNLTSLRLSNLKSHIKMLLCLNDTRVWSTPNLKQLILRNINFHDFSFLPSLTANLVAFEVMPFNQRFDAARLPEILAQFPKLIELNHAGITDHHDDSIFPALNVPELTKESYPIQTIRLHFEPKYSTGMHPNFFDLTALKRTLNFLLPSIGKFSNLRVKVVYAGHVDESQYGKFQEDAEWKGLLGDLLERGVVFSLEDDDGLVLI